MGLATSVLWIGLAGIVIAVFYSLPPFKFSYRGWGEFSVALAFGPLILSGIYLVLTNTWIPQLLIISLPIGLFIANVLIVNEIPDYEEDLRGGKRNLIVILGPELGVKLFGFIFLLGYISFVVLALYFKNPVWLIGLAGIPVAWKTYKIACKNFDNSQKFMKANEKTIQVYMIMGITIIISLFFISF
jgi:1,4-dihydroxy-2-naphthoate octaprenyltransferase